MISDIIEGRYKSKYQKYEPLVALKDLFKLQYEFKIIWIFKLFIYSSQHQEMVPTL